MSERTTAGELMRNKPSAHDVDRVESLWRDFGSTTQFLEAIRQAMIRSELDRESNSLERFIPVMAEVEAQDLNELSDSLKSRTYVGDFWKDPCWKETGAACPINHPITQRSKVG